VIKKPCCSVRPMLHCVAVCHPNMRRTSRVAKLCCKRDSKETYVFEAKTHVAVQDPCCDLLQGECQKRPMYLTKRPMLQCKTHVAVCCSVSSRDEGDKSCGIAKLQENVKRDLRI